MGWVVQAVNEIFQGRYFKSSPEHLNTPAHREIRAWYQNRKKDSIALSGFNVL
jgi:hypothetical protein